jgi:hypothetical protein
MDIVISPVAGEITIRQAQAKTGAVAVFRRMVTFRTAELDSGKFPYESVR